MMQKLKPYTFPLLISIAVYLVFYYQMLLPNMFFWRNDVETFYFPVRVYIYESIINEGRLPFWTEKVFSGFPLYADLEAGVLHLPNVLSILLFGPVWSYKLWHFGSYLLGSLSLYILLKRLLNVSLAGFFIANAIFFFSYYQQYHLSHFNITLVAYLLPTYLLLADLYVQKRQLRYIVANSTLIASGIYFGHMQTVLIMLIGIFVYFAIFSYKQIKLSVFALYWALLGFLIFIQTLPQLYSTYLLLDQSRRIAGDVSHLEGSFSPFMFLLYIYPTLFGVWPNNFGDIISFDYTLVETYIYMGIVGFILGVAGFIFTKNTSIKLFSFIVFMMFLVLGFWKFIPIFSNVQLPALSLFRHWPRIVVLPLFGFAAMAAAFITHGIQTNRKQFLQNLGFLAIPVVYLGLLTVTNLDNSLMRHTINVVRANLNQVTGTNFMVWIISLVAGLCLLVFFILFKNLKYKKALLVVVVLLCFATLFDIRYFAQNPLEQRIHNIYRSLDNTYIPTFSPELDNKRILHVSTTKKLNGNAGLYNKNWWPYGYSQLGNIKYEDRFIRVSKGTSVRNVHKSPITSDSHTKLRELGVYAIVDDKRITFLYPQDVNLIELTNPALLGEYLIKKEGHIKFVVNLDAVQVVNTSIKNFTGWQITVNGQKTKMHHSSDLFINVFLHEGENTVEFRYVALPVYYALGASALLLGFLVGAYVLLRQRVAFELINNPITSKINI